MAHSVRPGPIQDWFLHEKQPPLTILAMSGRRHRPGEGFIAWNVNDLDEGYEQVYAFPGELVHGLRAPDGGSQQVSCIEGCHGDARDRRFAQLGWLFAVAERPKAV